MSTGDLRNNLLKVQAELKSIQYDGPLNTFGASKGDPTSILPILHYTLLSFSPLLATHFAAKGYELYGKNDSRFLEAVYSLLLKEFTYRPVLNRPQFFTTGFAERKLIFVTDVIQFCKKLHQNLARNSNIRRSSSRKNVASLPVVNASPELSPGKSVSFQTSKTQTAEEGKFRTVKSHSRYAISSHAPRYFSPEIVLASLYHNSPRASSPLPSRKDTFHHDYDTSVDKSPIPKSLQKTATSSGQGANYAWKAYAPGAYSSQFSPARGITKTSEYSSYPMDGVHQENAAPEAALALSDLDDYSYINKSTRSESPLVQRNESPLRNSTINGRSPIALSSPIYSFGRTVQPMNASQSSRLTFPVKPRQSAFSKIPFSRMSSPEGTEAKEDTKSLSVQSRQGTPVAEALVIESVTSPLERDVEALKTKHEELKKDVYGLKEREGAHQQELGLLCERLHLLEIKYRTDPTERSMPIKASVIPSFPSQTKTPTMQGTDPHQTSSVKKIIEEAEERLLRTSQFLARSKAGSVQPSPTVQPLA